MAAVVALASISSCCAANIPYMILSWLLELFPIDVMAVAFVAIFAALVAASCANVDVATEDVTTAIASADTDDARFFIVILFSLLFSLFLYYSYTPWCRECQEKSATINATLSITYKIVRN